MKMRKRVQIQLELARKTHENHLKMQDNDFVGGKAGKKLDLAQWVARISMLQDLLNDERWGK